MLLRYRDRHFWETFHARHWRARVPTVFRQPFREFPFTEEMVFRGLKRFKAALEAKDDRFRYMFALGDSSKAPRRELRRLLQGGESSMAELERDGTRSFPDRSVGLMVNNFQSLDPGLWSGVTAFLQDAHPWIDFPIARAVVDLFFGNYARSFLGLHKDTQEIFGFVVRGEKVILAWPFDYFVNRVKGISAAARYFQVQLPVDYRKYRQDALVLKARAGDVIFWPSDYWHLAEATPGRYSCLLSLGLFPSYLGPKRAEELDRFRRELTAGTKGHASMRSRQMTEVKRGALGTIRLRWATGLGFKVPGPVSGRSWRTSHPDRAKGELRKKRTTLLLWTVGPARRRIVIAANGHSISLPHSQKTVSLLKRIADGKVVPCRSAEGKLVDWLFWVQAVEAP